MDPSAFFGGELPERLLTTGEAAARSARRGRLPPLALEIEGARWTLVPSSDSLEVQDTVPENAVRVRLDPDSFSALIEDHKSTLGLSIAGRIELLQGEGAHLVGWDPVLRSAIDGRPAYQPGSISLTDESGAPLDVRRRFRLEDSPAQMQTFLAEAGFLALESVFTEQEMAGVLEDLERAEAAARPDDGTSWWVRTSRGEHRPSRILNFFRQSKSLQELAAGDRFRALGALGGEGHVHSDSFGEHFAEPTAEGLMKPVGVSEGIADLGWHKDCARGGHSRFCCGLTIGIALTPADEESGELRVVAGSHRANLVGAGLAEDVDLPVVSLPAKTGDVSIHCSCTLHEARPPRTKERRVVYTGFGLPPKFADDDLPADRASLERERADIGQID